MNKYIKVFNTDTDYQSFISGEIDKPNLSYVKATNEVHYNPFIDYSKEYLTFEALKSGTFTLTVPANVTSTYMTSVSYSTDDGANWTTTTIDNTLQTITTPTINAGGKVLWKGEGKAMSADRFNKISQFNGTICNVSGNIMSLLYGDNFVNQTTFPSGSTNTFYKLFYSFTGIRDASNLILPATTLANSCYQYMFSGCTSLTTAPVLPATTLATGCYNSMFSGCTSLTTAPSILPAATLAQECYNSMFNGCTSLTTAPELPATTLTQSCYRSMFQGCNGLTTAPALPATTLVNYCYHSMFEDCTSLTTAPALPATTLVNYCYHSMFQNCTSLTTAPELPATTLASSCYQYMFKGCTSLTTAPELPATTLATGCYKEMFSGCTQLNNIKMLATDISATNCLNNWVQNVAATGTFTKSAEITNLEIGTSGIPENWTVVDA